MAKKTLVEQIKDTQIELEKVRAENPKARTRKRTQSTHTQTNSKRCSFGKC